MRYQAQTFVKQVQIDLLALSDADLLYAIDQWKTGNTRPDLAQDALEVSWSALGYTFTLAEVALRSHPPGGMSEVELEAQKRWHAPSPHHLRELLTAMDAKQFAQHAITLAFQALHASYPEWGDGSTFNAHLANHLRWMRMNRRVDDPKGYT